MSTAAGHFQLADHLPALLVVIPLLGSAVVALLRTGWTAWLVTLVISWILPVLAVMLVFEILDKKLISYAIGGWPPPFGIEYRIDLLNAFVLLLVAGVGAIVMPYAMQSVGQDVDEHQQPLFYAIYLLALTGLLGMAASGDAFNIFVFMEVSSLATYVLIAMGRDRRALLAAYQYLIMGTIGATLYVIGVGILYILTGSLNLADVSTRIGPAFAQSPESVIAAVAFLTVGISLKLALFPLHVWLPNAYAYAPPFATVFLAATATKVAVYIMIRMTFSVFGPAISLSTIPVLELLLLLSIAAMFVASFLALYEDNIERMLAYSSVAQIGYITLGIALANVAGLTGSLVHLMNHAVMKAALFAAIGAVAFRIGTARLSELGGLGHRMPLTMAAFVIGGLSIIGVPGTAGFISKWYLGVGAVEHGYWPVAFLIVASSIISVLYIGRVVECAYFRPVSEACERASDPPLSMLIPIGVFAALTIYLGLETGWSAGLADLAAQALVERAKP